MFQVLNRTQRNLGGQTGRRSDGQLPRTPRTDRSAQDVGAQEPEQLMEVVKWSGRFDQVVLRNGAGLEVVFRRLPTVDYFPTEPVRDGAPHDSGGGKGAGSLTCEEQEALAGTSRTSVRMVSPELLEYVGSDATQSSELMKSIVKSREFRDQLSKSNKK